MQTLNRLHIIMCIDISIICELVMCVYVTLQIRHIYMYVYILQYVKLVQG